MGNDQGTKRFYDLVWPHLSAVLRTARILTGSAADAEDLAQETMLKAFRAIGSIRDESDVKAWLFTILRRARIDRFRSVRNTATDVSLERLDAEPVALSQAEQPRQDWEGIEQALESFSDQQVIEALRDLPEEIRWTLLLLDVNGLAQEDAAQVLDVPVGTIKSRAHRGRSMLRQTLLPLARDRRVVRE